MVNCLKSTTGAGVAQLVEQLICNQRVVGSNPVTGSILLITHPFENYCFFYVTKKPMILIGFCV
jgi:hypothetical protein